MGWKGWREGERDREIQNHVYKQGTITIRCSMLLKRSGGHRRTTHLDLLGERGREHHGLALAHRRHPILLHNATDLRLKPHVQHTVSLIQHQIPCEGGREERGEEGKGRERIRRAQVDSKHFTVLLCHGLTGTFQVQPFPSPSCPPAVPESPPATDSHAPGL